MAGVDKKLCAVEERKCEQEQRRELFKQTSMMRPDPSHTVDFEESISSDDERDILKSKDSEMCESIIMPIKNKRGRKEIMTSRLASALDKCKVSDRDAVHLLIACAEVFNVNVNDYAINRSSVKRSRESFRYQISSEIKTAFHQLNLNFAVVHWDSKILPNMIGTENVDRLPVIITAPNVEQLLGVPHLSSGTGKEISSAVYDTLKDWSMLEKVQAFVFDTTASNSGRLNGSCVLLEQMLNRPILFLACRHHIFEIILQSVFSYSKLTTMSGPEIPIFKRFKNNWNQIDQTKYSTWVSDNEVKKILHKVGDDVIIFCKDTLNQNLPRDDYKEFLELVIIFLGGVPPKGIHFKRPGAYHLARWMCKGIYCLKIYIFQEQFKLTKAEITSLKTICCFIVKCYIEFWFRSPNAIEAPYNDVLFLRKLEDYKSDDKQVAELAIKKFINHLWYLGEETACFSLFDDRIENHVKKQMAQQLLENDELQEDELTTEIQKNMFQLSMEFLHQNPKNWPNIDSYIEAKNILHHLSVINDAAERGVKLMEDFNTKFTKNENQKQYVLKVVQEYRKKYPSHTKDTLTKDAHK
ncbi:hypothetical protein QTP88_025495 [Uroleucon formosanum]